MLIKNHCDKILQAACKLQGMIHNNTVINSLDKLKAQEAMDEIRTQMSHVFDYVDAPPATVDTQPSFSKKELDTMAGSLVYDVRSAFKTMRLFKVVAQSDITFLRERKDNILAMNTFTGQNCHIRIEFGNDLQTFYVVQYPDGSYSVVADKSIRLSA